MGYDFSKFVSKKPFTGEVEKPLTLVLFKGNSKE